VELAVVSATQNKAESQGEIANLKDMLQKLYDGYEVRVFGDSKDVSAAAKQLIEWTGKMLQQLELAPFDQAAAIELLRHLCRMTDDSGGGCGASRRSESEGAFC
jgi:hypothetical protein